MADIPDHVVLIVAALFFVVAAVVGVCLYYFYFKTRNDSEEGRQTAKRFKRNFGMTNPFAFYLAGVTPIEFSGTAFTIELDDEKNLASKFCVGEDHCKMPEKTRVCRSTSYEKPLRSPCHLQAIQEAEEENEEEVDK